MCKHETKQCPRCHRPFECKPGNISQCQCYGIGLGEEQKAFIAQRYNDCLCRDCLQALKSEVTLFLEKYEFAKR